MSGTNMKKVGIRWDKEGKEGKQGEEKKNKQGRREIKNEYRERGRKR